MLAKATLNAGGAELQRRTNKSPIRAATRGYPTSNSTY